MAEPVKPDSALGKNVLNGVKTLVHSLFDEITPNVFDVDVLTVHFEKVHENVMRRLEKRLEPHLEECEFKLYQAQEDDFRAALWKHVLHDATGLYTKIHLCDAYARVAEKKFNAQVASEWKKDHRWHDRDATLNCVKKEFDRIFKDRRQDIAEALLKFVNGESCDGDSEEEESDAERVELESDEEALDEEDNEEEDEEDHESSEEDVKSACEESDDEDEEEEAPPKKQKKD